MLREDIIPLINDSIKCYAGLNNQKEDFAYIDDVSENEEFLIVSLTSKAESISYNTMLASFKKNFGDSLTDIETSKNKITIKISVKILNKLILEAINQITNGSVSENTKINHKKMELKKKTSYCYKFFKYTILLIIFSFVILTLFFQIL